MKIKIRITVAEISSTSCMNGYVLAYRGQFTSALLNLLCGTKI